MITFPISNNKSREIPKFLEQNNETKKKSKNTQKNIYFINIKVKEKTIKENMKDLILWEI